MRTLFLASAFFVFSTAQSQVPTAIAYSSVELLVAVNQPSAADAYVWLSADGLRLYYTKDIGAGNRLMLLTRPTVAAPFGAAVAVLPDYGADQTSGSLSADELTLWFSSSNSIMRTTRANTAAAFNAPETLTIVGIGNYPKSPTLTPDEEQMVLHTSNGLDLLQRTGPAEYTVTGAIPSQPIDVSPAKMSHDGLRIYFSGPFGASYLPYRMSRASVSDAFSELEYLSLIHI